MKKLLAVLFSAIIGFTFILSANAQETSTPAFTLKNNQGNLNYESTPGSKIQDSINIINLDPERIITVKLNSRPSTETVNTITSKGLPNEWITFSKNEVNLQPNESINVEVEIAIPKDADLGPYTSTIVSSLIDYKTPDEPLSQNGSVKVSIGIGLNLTLNLVEGKAHIQDHRAQSVDSEMRNDKDYGDFQKIARSFYKVIEDNLELILIFIIIALLLKMSMTNNSGSKEKPKENTTDLNISSPKQPNMATKMKSSKPAAKKPAAKKPAAKKSSTKMKASPKKSTTAKAKKTVAKKPAVKKPAAKKPAAKKTTKKK